MKTIKTVLIILAITLSNQAIANNTPIKKNPFTKETSSLVAKEISTLLVTPNFEVINDLKAQITFVSNQNNEIVVLKVDTDNKQLEHFIKMRLNYHILSIKLSPNRTYQLPIKVVLK